MDLKLALKYMTNSVNKKEKLAFKKWMAQSETNQMKYEQFASNWDKMASGLKDIKPDEQKAWQSFVAKYHIEADEHKAKSKYLFIAQWKSIAAAILLLVSSIFFINKSEIFHRKPGFLVYSAHDSLLTVSLIDGSEVCLNKNSELKVPAWRKYDDRTVFLTGEAFFEIAADANRPFLVHTSHTTTRVLGTSFNLRSSEQSDIVALIRGKVKFYAGDNENNAVILKPGEMISYNPQTKQTNKTVLQDNNFMAWKTGELDFNNAPLPDVLNTITEYYHLKLSGDFQSFDKYSLTANFMNQPVEKVISVLELTWNVEMTTRNDTLYLTFN